MLFAVTAIASNAQTFNTIANFEYTNGQHPMGLVQATDGNLYGVTEWGGANNSDLCSLGVGCGTVFEMTTAGTLTTLYSFCSQTNCADGFFPRAAPVQGTDGNFYADNARWGRLRLRTWHLRHRLQSHSRRQTGNAAQVQRFSYDGAEPRG